MRKPSSKAPRSAEKFSRKAGQGAVSGRKSKLPSPSGQHPPDGPKLSGENLFPVAGVGASAGGLEAFTQLLANLPARTGMAFVFVQHLDPKRESMLAEILARSAPMPLTEVKGPTVVEANHVYVAPRATDIRIEKRVLSLTPHAATGHPHLAVDYFFRSLAADLGNKAIGVILSGTGSDGSLGLKAIKAEGGITFAQEEASARYDGMPSSAITTGCVDFVLPPDKIAEELTRLGTHPYLAPPIEAPPEEVIPVPDNVLMRILDTIHRATGVDLSQYKPNTIKRRILRRMLLNKLESLDLYVKRLQAEPAEVHALYEDMLINVTQFFRDPETFQALKTDVFPKIAGEGVKGPVRIWVPGCSTGEEVYSLAICLLEYLEDRADQVGLQIFGTDISEHALEKARAGLYSENIAADVSSERLKRFFVKVDRGYQINKGIREACIFARQNLAKDPPFSKLDLISCRNVLIYLGQPLQKKVLPIFHYALKPAGYLLLGSSETPASYAEMFTLVDNKHKIFARKPTPPRLPVDFTYAPPAVEPKPATKGWHREGGAPTPLDLQKEADHIVLSRYGPPGVIVNEELEVIQFRGQTGMYLEPPSGPASYHLLRMAREGLIAELRTAMHRARHSDKHVRREGLRVKHNGDFREFDLEVTPMRRSPQGGRCFLILFRALRKSTAKQPKAKAPARTKGQESEELKTLREELETTKESLRAIIEEQEASNEELRSANEEIQSSNEELQSTNEELETAKEEQQSSNEELNTVNAELEARNTQLAQVNDDLRNLLSNVNLPIVMVGNDLRIRRFTPQAEKVLSLIPTDAGRPIGNIRPNIHIPNLEELLTEAIETPRMHEAEVQDVNGRWYLLRIRPYRTEDNKIEGAVMVLVDVDQLRRTLDESQEARDFNQSIIETVRAPLLVLDKGLRVKLANPAFCQAFHAAPVEITDRFIYEIAGGTWNLPRLHELLEELLPTADRVDDFEAEHDFPGIGRRVLLFNPRRFYRGSERAEMILLAVQDVTGPKRAREELEQRVRQRTAELQAATDSLTAQVAERERIQAALRQSELALLANREELRGLTAGLFAAHEEERRRISRELHDALNQKLAMLEIDVDSLEHKLPTSPGQIREQLGSLRVRVGEVSNEIRRMAYELHPSVLDDLGLQVALRSYVSELTKHDGLEIKFAARGIPESLPQDVALSLYRIAQEALRNVVKHARAKRASVTLEKVKNGIRLSVRDHGAGFDPEAIKGKRGLGLVSIEERVRLLSGHLAFHSRPGEGTQVEVTIPIPPQDDLEHKA